MDSQSAECVEPESIAKNVPLVETEASRQGQNIPTTLQMVVSSRTKVKRL